MSNMIYCPFCGRQTDPNMAFCPYCGKKKMQPAPQPQVQVPQQPVMPQPQVQQPWAPQPQMQPQQAWAPQTMPQPEKKKKLGLIIGIVAAAVAVIAAVIICVLVFGGNNPEKVAKKAAEAAYLGDPDDFLKYCEKNSYMETLVRDEAHREAPNRSFEQWSRDLKAERELELRQMLGDGYTIHSYVSSACPEMKVQEVMTNRYNPYSMMLGDDAFAEFVEMGILRPSDSVRAYEIVVFGEGRNNGAYDSDTNWLLLVKRSGKWVIAFTE